jgi:tetratricopeptide (TPR) repeat protein
VDLLLRAGRRDEAIKELEALAAANPKDPATLELAGDATAEGAPLDAAKFYAAAARLAPENVEYRLKLGAALVRAGRYADAVEHLSFAASREPERREAHANLAAALFGAARYAEAAREFRWVAGREPESAMTQYYLGASLEREGECHEALAAFERFLSLADPQKLKNEIANVTFHVPALKRQIENGSCDRAKKELEKKGTKTKDAKDRGGM